MLKQFGSTLGRRIVADPHAFPSISSLASRRTSHVLASIATVPRQSLLLAHKQQLPSRTTKKHNFPPQRSYVFIPDSWQEIEFQGLQSVPRVMKVPIHVPLIGRQRPRYLGNTKRESATARLLSLGRQMISKARASLKRKLRGGGGEVPLALTSAAASSRRRLVSRQRRRYTKNIVLREYAEARWFDRRGRPLTTRNAAGKFVNPWQSQTTAGWHTWTALFRWRWARWMRRIHPNHSDDAVHAYWHADRHAPETRRLDTRKQVRLTWVAHATCLLQHGGLTLITDPMFSNRAAPAPLGVPRSVPAAPLPDDVDMDVGLISHDHYDHLDLASIQQLEARSRLRNNRQEEENTLKSSSSNSSSMLWIVPLGIKRILVQQAGVEAHRVVELAWWESVALERRHGTWTAGLKVMDQHSPCKNPNSVYITLCPSQHWASRSPWDRNTRLWGSFLCRWPNTTVFFAGDTAKPVTFPLMQQIRAFCGPHRVIDVAALPVGAYHPRYYMETDHMDPAQAVQVHQLLGARYSVGIHWGSFGLSEEPLDEPPVLVQQASRKAGVDAKAFCMLAHGQSLTVPVRRKRHGPQRRQHQHHTH